MLSPQVPGQFALLGHTYNEFPTHEPRPETRSDHTQLKPSVESGLISTPCLHSITNLSNSILLFKKSSASRTALGGIRTPISF
jgi:hypothetical protein